MVKNTFLVKNFCDNLEKNNFELKMLKLLENHVNGSQLAKMKKSIPDMSLL